MEAAESKQAAESAAIEDANAAASTEHPETEGDDAGPQSAAAEVETAAGVEGVPQEGLNGLPLSKSQAKKRAKHEAKQAKKAERKEREKRQGPRNCFTARLQVS